MKKPGIISCGCFRNLKVSYIDSSFPFSREEEKIFLGNVIHAGSGREACRVRLVFD